MSNLRFKDRLDSELQHMEFTAQSRQKVLERAKELQEDQKRSVNISLKHVLKLGQTYMVWLERIKGFLDTELKIPVTPVAVALLITLSSLIYGCIGVTNVSAEEIQKSSITVVDGNQGGQANELYKD